ncbi:hypothetical protein Daura_04810 [Dactylosporangium aurantiacum]|uniref:Uncharacterized protein n=1 Tax=Dactylosporangium aurantiacum TaxID=35754 RepID=A0A9Q9ILK2_9ACTN|nr:hypothetical protein [Dactylosporangium aurantiacum]MDG6104912.1 hypothetical protein [Dactylosporangium aurantiacum]UWZ55549.1 hypothetical protein Daura_04810 [Dactylosporangium aurantiacum]
MSIRAQFDAAIDAEPGPPPRLDVDGIVRGGRIRRRLTMAGASLAVTATLGVVGFVAATAPGQGGIPDPPPSRRPPSSAAPPSAETSPTPGYGTTATPGVPAEAWNAAQAARLSGAVERHLRAAAAKGTTFLDTPVNLQATGPFEFGTPGGAADRYAARFVTGPDLRDAAGIGTVAVAVGKPIGPLAEDGRPWPPGYGIGQFQQCPGDAADRERCEVRAGPHGEKVVVMPYFQDEGGKRIARVDVTTADGTGVTVEVRNFSLFRPGGRAELPVTVEQMIALAVDPDLVISVT